MPQDVAELDKYLNENGWIILADRMPDKKLIIRDKLQNSNSLKSFFCLENQIEQIKCEYIPEKNIYWIVEMQSPVVEYIKASFDKNENTIRRGRIYYKKESLSDDEKTIEQRNDEFLHKAEQLFKWFKKTFKNQKINSFHTTKRTSEWLQLGKGKLIEL